MSAATAPSSAAPARRSAGRWVRLRRGATLPALGLLLWWAAFRFHWTDSSFYVPPAKVVEAARALSASGELWPAVGASLLRAGLGFAIGAAAGIAIGAWVGASRPARRLLEPTLRVPAGLSTFAWIPLLIAWFGLGEGSKLAFVALAAFFPVLINTLEGVGGISHHYVEVARVFRFSPWQLFRRVLLPAAAPSIFNGVYLAIVAAWGATLAAEYLMTSTDGIGRLLIDGQQNAAMDQAILCAAVAGAVGAGLHLLAARGEAWLLRRRALTVPGKARTSPEFLDD